MLAAVGALLIGLWAGLIRIGWHLPPRTQAFPAAHGPLMAVGFLGTLIGLERAAALRAAWTYAAPVFAAAGAVVLVAGSTLLGKGLFVLAGAAFAAVCLQITRLQPALHTRVMGLGALAWLGGAILWYAGGPLFRVAPWWAAFLTLTILGERLELSRVLRLSRGAVAWFTAGFFLFALGLGLSLLVYAWGLRLMGTAMVLLAVWLLGHDLARFSMRMPGPGQFTAIALVSGYLWLGIGGVLWVILAGVRAGPLYDTMLHTVFLGFVFAMIFGHAPVILPAVLARPLPVARRFYLHLGLLHAALILRLAGDLTGSFDARRWGGLLGVVAVLAFLATTAAALRRQAGPRTKGT